jgi:signal transduction histidine kinase
MLIAQARKIFEATSALRRHKGYGYAIAVAATGAGLALRFAFGAALDGFPFLTFFPPVFLVTFFCGWRAGVLCALLGALCAWYWFVPPLNSVELAWPSSWIAMAFYAVTVAAFVFLTAEIQSGFSEYVSLSESRGDLNAALEARVRARTAELRAAYEQLQLESESRALIEGQLRQAQRLEAVGQLTGGVAHDFNNMLAIVIGSLDMARRRLERDPARAARHIEAALAGANRAADLTARLLAFARRQPLEPKPLNANQLIAGMSELLRRTLGESIHVETRLADDLWRTFADGAQLENALINLCVNARDAMGEAGRLTIETANAELDDAYSAAQIEITPGAYIAVSVADTGAGMSEEVIAKAFEPFFTTKGAGSGTGLGLSQVYGFVKQTGGHVKIHSELGAGTTVRLYLPRYIGEAAAAAAAPAAAPARARDGEVVLLVEDQEAVREMSAAALRELGYDVMEAGDAAKALELLSAAPRVSVLFTDIVMPDLNGRELAEQARREMPALKVLFTTGYTHNAVIHDGQIEPGAEILPKPFTIDQLAVKLRRVLDAH